MRCWPNFLICAVISILLLSCGSSNGAGPPTPSSNIETEDLSDLKPVNIEGPYSALLKSCLVIQDGMETCRLSDLPLIGQKSSSPTIPETIDRLVVSHDWMGERFRQALDRLPQDIQILMKAVTGVVIDDDVRPSFYGVSGAIYIDPAYLWLTREEKATINKEEDYRAGFGRDLSFVPLSRFVIGNDYAYDFYSLDGTETRTLDDIYHNFGRLLYHELAHANDFFPPTQIPDLDSDQSVFDAMKSTEPERISYRLRESIPLTSNIMKELAGVLFGGEKPSQEQKIFTAGDIGSFFEKDGANDEYNYFSSFEDVAMLFEEVMMKFHFSMDRDIAFTNRPTDLDATCNSYIVGWGSRMRIGDPLVRSRAAFVATELLPDQDFTDFFNDLDEPLKMDVGAGWCDALETGKIKPPLIERDRSKSDKNMIQRGIIDSLPGAR